MARLPRLLLPGHAHVVLQRAHGGRAVFVDDADRQRYLEGLRDAAAATGVTVHAYALGDDGVRLLLTPGEGDALSRCLQAVGRRYVSTYNRTHAQRGTLWDGRFRCGVVEDGAPRLLALRWIDGQSGATSAAQRSGGPREGWLSDPPEYWSLGNTPFDREAVYRTLLVQGVPAADRARLEAASAGGWTFGSPAFASEVAAQVGRPAQPRPRGRPPRAP